MKVTYKEEERYHTEQASIVVRNVWHLGDLFKNKIEKLDLNFKIDIENGNQNKIENCLKNQRS